MVIYPIEKRGGVMPVNVKAKTAELLRKLSKEKNIDKITVKDLAEDQGISRQAFCDRAQDIPEAAAFYGGGPSSRSACGPVRRGAGNGAGRADKPNRNGGMKP